jgi:hypothetical protein
MVTRDPSKTGAGILTVLWALTYALTIWLAIVLTNAATRSTTFAFDIFLACLLETMAYGYFAYLLWRRPKPRIGGGFLPATGVVVISYAAVSLLLVLCRVALYPTARSTRTYFIVLAVETLMFLVVLGAVLILNAHKTSEDEHHVADATRSMRTEDQLSEVLQTLTREGVRLEKNALHDTESALRRVMEKIAYSLPFGRIPSAAGIEGEIAGEVSSLRDSLSRALDGTGTEPTSALTSVRRSVDRILDLMSRRDRLVVR